MRIYELIEELSSLPINRLQDEVILEVIGEGYKHIEDIETTKTDYITLCLVNSKPKEK